ncbi:tetratricopeptide repeat protein [Pseudalkalibacillus salsuginis]|uniref:tetratricopeptide repeat protein n=1 Tax=Pseudalkalibacillus salsuginis TaxID=2910972 RepID=UPI001F42DFCE|nr:tetratricopeptide repeat protein [Pseudalkalibacillus salsuginis]MCF6411584.1 tetratricopeptide repeat protein [Pseudalkalibacillus salsuginis]
MNTNNNSRELLEKAIALREDGRAKQDMTILKEARNLLLNMSENDPENAEINYQIGIAYDNSGLSNKAIPYYVKAIEQGLSGSDLQRCLLGLGSTYRLLGHYKEAVETLHRGVTEFPEHRGLQVFYSMALYNTGEYKKAMEIVLMNLMETTNDETLQYFKRGISYYAQHLDETWN